LWVFFLLSFLGDLSFDSCSFFFFFYPKAKYLSWKFLRVFFVLLGSSIVQFLLKLANITEQHLQGTIFLFFSSLFFLVLLDTCLLILSLRYAVFLLGFCSLFLLRGFGLAIYLKDGSTPTSPARGPSSRVVWNSLLRICYSQIVEAMTDPNPKGSKGLVSMSFWAS
jgi:hypothetical protein